MKRLLYSGLCLIFLALSSFSNTTAQDDSVNDDSDIPYIYYFSADLNAVVVERADGTDTRILGDGLLETAENYDQVEGYTITESAWSPSGEWLAWKIIYVGRYGTPAYKTRLFVISADGQRVLPIVHDYYELDFVWSPTDDVLAFYGQVGEPDRTWVNPEYALITLYDFTRNEIVFSQQTDALDFPIDFDSYSFHPILAHWTMDGQHIIFESRNNRENIAHYLVVNHDGTLYVTYRFENTIPIEDDYYNPSALGNEWVTYRIQSLSECAVILQNIITDEQQVFELSENGCLLPEMIIWNPNYNYAYLAGGGLWLWSEHGLQPLDVEPQYESYEYKSYLLQYTSIWSPNGQHAMVQGDNGIFHIDALAEQVSLIIPLNDSLPIYNLFWVWINDQETFVSGIQSGEQVIDYHFNFEADTSEISERLVIASQNPSFIRYGTFTMTTDMSTEIYLSDGPVIYDRTNKTYQSLRPAYASARSAPGDLVYLSENEEWVLLDQEDTVSSGGAWRGDGHRGIMRIDGTQYRDLTNPLFFAEWLPSQVSLTTLPVSLAYPLYPSPRQILQRDEWIQGLDWSPDSKYLATQYRDVYQDAGYMILWNIETSESKILYPLEARPLVDVVWEEQTKQEWFPTIVTRAGIPRQYIKDLEPWNIGAISPDQSQIFIFGEYGELGQIYDLTTNQVVSEFKCLSRWWLHGPADYAFSPDGSQLACSSGIWDVKTGEKLSGIPIFGTSFEFSPDGTQLAIGASWDILIYDVDELLAWKLPE